MFPMLAEIDGTGLFMIITLVLLVALTELMSYTAHQTHKETERVMEERRQQRERDREKSRQRMAIIEEQIAISTLGLHGYLASKSQPRNPGREK